MSRHQWPLRTEERSQAALWQGADGVSSGSSPMPRRECPPTKSFVCLNSVLLMLRARPSGSCSSMRTMSEGRSRKGWAEKCAELLKMAERMAERDLLFKKKDAEERRLLAECRAQR